MKKRMGIEKRYFEWLVNFVCHDRFAKNISYRKLLDLLHDTMFTWSISKDSNRAADGSKLRRRFASLYYDNVTDATEDLEYLLGPCSILEMLIALAIRCETDIMHDPSIGDRTGQWFWKMINNLGLGDMMDDRFDEEYAFGNITLFLDRSYEPDGRGGLFTVRNCEHDLRKVEIWVQLLWYLDTIS